MKTRIIIIVLLFLLPEVFVGQNSKINQKFSENSILELLNVIQFRNLSYSAFVKQYKNFWLYSMDYDENHLPRRIMKAPSDWEIEINGLIFKDLTIVFLDNKIDYVMLRTGNKDKFSLTDFINFLVEKDKGKIISKNKSKIIVELNDAHRTKLECYFPVDYYESDTHIFISMKQK